MRNRFLLATLAATSLLPLAAANAGPVLLFAAGGGGGAGYSSGNGSSGQSGSSGAAGFGTRGGGGGTNASGGSGGTFASGLNGGGGAGWQGSGGAGAGSTSGGGGTSGGTWAGGAPGSSFSAQNGGGYGGGGGGGGDGGGGGGGYSGGGGGDGSCDCGGGGGASYIDIDPGAVTNGNATAGHNGSTALRSPGASGFVTIDSTHYSYTGGKYDWTATTTGTYHFVVDGAQGGSGIRTGGYGAELTGDLFLSAGTILELVIGGGGNVTGINTGAGGGGGTFVYALPAVQSGSAVPEPDTAALFGIAIAALALRRRVRTSRQRALR